jgi:hypothetical protein
LNKARDDIAPEFQTIAGCLLRDHYDVLAIARSCSARVASATQEELKRLAEFKYGG